MKKNLYFDGAANTPIDKKVLKAMMPYMKNHYVGNSFSPHMDGQKSMMAIEDARKTILNSFGYSEDTGEKIYFTSGSTEANNWVIQSLCIHELSEAKRNSEYIMKNEIVCSTIEHASVLSACKAMEELGFVIKYAKPTTLKHSIPGSVITSKARKLITDRTLLVCIMSVNNETGISNPVNEIAAVAHSHGAYMLSDMTQALSYGGDYIDLHKKYPRVDYMTMSGHKIYGPLGTGCLIRNPEAPLYPFIHGGHQEDGLRGGTSNTAGIVGLAKAVELMKANPHELYYEHLYKVLLENLGDIGRINVKPKYKYIVSLNISGVGKFPFQAVDYMNVNGISCSAASACHTEFEPTLDELSYSYVLKELGFTEDQMINTIRLSFTKYTTEKDIIKFCNILKELKEANK